MLCIRTNIMETDHIWADHLLALSLTIFKYADHLNIWVHSSTNFSYYELFCVAKLAPNACSHLAQTSGRLCSTFRGPKKHEPNAWGVLHSFHRKLNGRIFYLLKSTSRKFRGVRYDHHFLYSRVGRNRSTKSIIGQKFLFRAKSEPEL